MGKDVWRVRVVREGDAGKAATVTITRNESTVYQGALPAGTKVHFDLPEAVTMIEPRGANLTGTISITT